MYPGKAIFFVIFCVCTDLDGVKLLTFPIVHCCLTTTSIVIYIVWTNGCAVVLLNDVIKLLIVYQ